MRQIIQNYKTGELKIEEVPIPQIQSGRVLVKNYYSIISSGTEKTKIDTAKKNLVGKAISRPDLVKQVIERAKKEGIWKTKQLVSQRLDTPVPLGYSCSGEVINTAENVKGLRQGDIVACGGNFANHAEFISVPKNLVVPVPEGVKPEHAAFATLGAIALQGTRLAGIQIGEKVAVIGLGLIGLLVVQIINASGGQVIGIDISPEKIAIGSKMGCKEVVTAEDETLEKHILDFTNGYGVDATIITAGTPSNRPIEQAGAITREKGRVIVVGAVGMSIPREPYYMKEIDLRISRSYGPGRYDKVYEEKGHDYPFAYVRFTEQRNMMCFLELLMDKKIDIAPLITHKFSFEDAVNAYDIIHGKSKDNYYGVLLEYKRDKDEIPKKIELVFNKQFTQNIVVGVIGAGNYASSNILPFLKAHPEVSLGSVCTASGMTALNVANKFGFKSADSNIENIIENSNALIIATRHNYHAEYALKALQHDKPVFVEKPLAIHQTELNKFIALAKKGIQGSLTVGFNRRFSPAVEMIKDHFRAVKDPKQIIIRVNAGPVPPDHWIHDSEVGGGRLIGEGCHFVDMALALTNSIIETVSASAIPVNNCLPSLWDNFSITLTMKDGSVCNIVYTSIGDRGVPKEYIEVFSGGKTGIIYDFQSIELWSGGKRKHKKWSKQEKGQKQQIAAWINSLKKCETSMSFNEIINVHKACFAAIESIKNRVILTIN